MLATCTPVPSPAHKMGRCRLAFFDSLSSATPARSPVCVDLSPHIEALLNPALGGAAARAPAGGTPAATAAANPLKTLDLSLSSPLAGAFLNIHAAEFKPPPVAPTPTPMPPTTTAAATAPTAMPSTAAMAAQLNPTAAEFVLPNGTAPSAASGGAASVALSASAPVFKPVVHTAAAPPPCASAAAPAPVASTPTMAMMRTQVQRANHEVDAATKRATLAEAAIARQRATQEAIERELAQMRIVVAAARASQQRDSRAAVELRQQLQAMGQEIGALRDEKDSLRAQVAALQAGRRDDRAERERLERQLARSHEAELKLRQQPTVSAPPPQAPHLAGLPMSTHSSSTAMPAPVRPGGAVAPAAHHAASRLPRAMAPVVPSPVAPVAVAAAAPAPDLMATVAYLQQEMMALRVAVHTPMPSAAEGAPPEAAPPPSAVAVLPPPTASMGPGLPQLPPSSLAEALGITGASAPLPALGPDTSAVAPPPLTREGSGRSRRGGRGKGNKGKAAAAAAAAAGSGGGDGGVGAPPQSFGSRKSEPPPTMMKENTNTNGPNWQLGSARRTLMQQVAAR